MASAVDICNLALSHLGDSATVTSMSPPEGSAQADHCANFYPIARDSLLESGAWSFSTRRAAGAALTNDRDEWAYCYAVPNLALTILGIFPEGTKEESQSQPFIKELNSNNTEVIYTDVENAVIKYTIAVTDTTKFTPLFVQTLAWHLAAMLAGPVLKGDAGAAEAKRCMQMAAVFQARAVESNMNQVNHKPAYTPAGIASR